MLLYNYKKKEYEIKYNRPDAGIWRLQEIHKHIMRYELLPG